MTACAADVLHVQPDVLHDFLGQKNIQACEPGWTC